MWECTAHLLLWFDPEERRAVRRMQKSQMGRYMHQDVHRWGEVDVDEFDGYYRDLTEMLANEAPLESAAENQM